MANATNQKKGIVTRGSGHIAESSGVSLPYFEKEKAGATVMDDNHIETSKCSMQEAARRTFIEAHNVIHHQSKIGKPHGGGASRYDRPHGFAQKNPNAYQWFAVSQESSPDTMVEGKWVVRTHDKTTQDGGNGTGKFSPGAGRVELLDEQELLFHQCAVDNIKLECEDGRWTMGRELHVLIGDTVKVTAFRVNATETDPEKRRDITCYITRYKERRKPTPLESKHAAFEVSRNGRTFAEARRWDEIPRKTLVGTSGELAVPNSKKMAKVSVLELKEEWLLEKPKKVEAPLLGEGEEDNETAGAVGPFGGSYDSQDIRQDGRNAGRDRRGEEIDAQVKRTGRRLEAAKEKPGRPGRASGAVGEAKRQATRAQARQAERERNQKSAGIAQGHLRLAVDSYKILSELFLFQPLTIHIEAHGCSPGAMATIKAFPPEPFGAELISLKDFPGKKTLVAIEGYVTAFSDFFKAIKGSNLRKFGPTPLLGKPCDFNIDVFFLRSKKGDWDVQPSVELTVQWKELTRNADTGNGEAAGRELWQVHPSWELDVKLERLLGLMINFEIDLNYCLGIGKVVTDLLDFFGVETGIFLDIDFNLSVGVAGTLSIDEYGKWGGVSGSVPVKAVIRLSIVAKVGQFFEVAFRVIGRWEPKFKFTKNKKRQAVIEQQESKYDIILLVEAKVDILGWDLEASYEVKKWRFRVPPTEYALFGGGP